MENETIFRKAGRGYNREDVNAFILKLNNQKIESEETLNDTIENQKKKIAELEEKGALCDSLQAQIEAKGRQNADCEAIIAAQCQKIAELEDKIAELEDKIASKEVKSADTVRQSGAIIADARAEAQRIIDSALADAEIIKANINEESSAVRADAERRAGAKIDEANDYIRQQLENARISIRTDMRLLCEDIDAAVKSRMVNASDDASGALRQTPDSLFISENE